MTEVVRPSLCRLCINFCPLEVTVRDGEAVDVRGDPSNAMWRGHTCVKGRSQHLRLTHSDRLLHSMKRASDGTFVPLSIEEALDEIAERLRAIIARHGPYALAGYLGTSVMLNALQWPFFEAFMRAAGSPMIFTPVTIDKPGKNIAKALLGSWMAPPTGFDRPDVLMYVGANPVVTYTGLPAGSPTWLSDQLKRGAQLIVVDPRRSDLAKRASIFLQSRPGHDALILAGLIHVILSEDLFDDEFVKGNTTGIDKLRHVTAPFTPELVTERADVDLDSFVKAARAFGRSRRGYIMAGTGPSMSGPGTLVEYLCLVLDTLAGHWLREGEIVRAVPTLLATPRYRAQAQPPRPARDLGVTMRVRGLTETPAGLPTAAAADEMLLDGERRIRGLISCSGNPAAAWPNQRKVVTALSSLELLVQIDPWMSQTAQLADYVIAPKMPLETVGCTLQLDFASGHSAGFGLSDAYGRYTPAAVEPPADSELIEEWEFYYGLARRLGYPLSISPTFGMLNGAAAEGLVPVDMVHKPTSEQLLADMLGDARVPLDRVRRHERGALFPDPNVRVGAKEPGWPHRLDIAHADMLNQLAQVLTAPDDVQEYPMRLVCRRVRGMMNSTVNDGLSTRGVRHNPAHVNPADLAALGLQVGDLVEITSRKGSLLAIVEADPAVRAGIVSMTHCYGTLTPSRTEEELRRFGSSTAWLVDDEIEYDTYSGQPRMSNVPVRMRSARSRAIPAELSSAGRHQPDSSCSPTSHTGSPQPTGGAGRRTKPHLVRALLDHRQGPAAIATGCSPPPLA
jgi:anaerobic selenocysteine-containing dehydrogenase